MKLKAFGICALIAPIFAISMTAFTSWGDSARGGRHANPQIPTPSLPLPQRPGQPVYPGLPGDPTIPPPGKFNPKGEPGVPFPMSTTLPFPWGNIEGTWKVVSGGTDILFSFTVQTDTNGHQYLRVQQINSANGTVLAEGVGVGVENDKLVRAAMTPKSGQASYMLFIGSYKNTSSYVVSGQTVKSVTVVTVRPFNALMGDKDVQVIVMKVSNSPFAGGQCPMSDN